MLLFLKSCRSSFSWFVGCCNSGSSVKSGSKGERVFTTRRVTLGSETRICRTRNDDFMTDICHRIMAINDDMVETSLWTLLIGMKSLLIPAHPSPPSRNFVSKASPKVPSGNQSTFYSYSKPSCQTPPSPNADATPSYTAAFFKQNFTPKLSIFHRADTLIALRSRRRQRYIQPSMQGLLFLGS